MPAPKFPSEEERVLRQWEERDIFRKSLEKPAPEGNFVFYEGPPGANGKPGIHHLISRTFKDLIPRYKTMRGYRVERKAGWDTHGLPVELEAEKQLGMKSKTDIEKFGVAAFNAKCKEIAWTYKQDWDTFTRRSGYWLDLAHPYITYEPDYIESLWWVTRQIADRGFLYEDYRVVPHCPRCVTTLSAHEVALGYDEVEDPSVFVRFKIKDKAFKGASFLVWTTTPWTLPGNVALAVGKDISYSEVELADGEHLILATSRLSVLEGEYTVKRELKGAELVDVTYVPIYDFVKYYGKAHYVADADFVSTGDGTGIVHTAVMYGADDFELGKKLGLPRQHMVDERGEFMEMVTPWKGLFVKKADPLIIEDLKERGALYRTEKVRHTYPFCWRCKTPLIYYAKPSWYFRTSAAIKEMMKANQEINWEPAHLKDGRFGEWLKGNKDWAITRERYWATPLPVWRCPEKHDYVVGSLEELSVHRTDAPMRILFVRHGEAENNVQNVISSGGVANGIHLTDAGRAGADRTAKKLKKEKIAAVYSSPVTRAKETADVLAVAAGVAVTIDERLDEVRFGVMNGKTETEYHAFYANESERWTKAPEGGESWVDVRTRMISFLREIDAKHRGETVAVVSHGDPIFVADVTLNNIPVAGQSGYRFPDFASVTEMVFPNWPWNAEGALDLHRPYVDEVRIGCPSCKKEMIRVTDVMDVWFDSGAMPFAQWHYPFENKDRIEKGTSYPADYISEAIDQTRGWFYTLVAVNTLLGYKHPPMKNVVCMNHILDAKGQKMSKSKGNVVDPWLMFEKYGADAVRFFFYTVNQPGDYKRFDEKDVDGVVKKVFLILWNVLEYWKLSKSSETKEKKADDHVLDRWMHARTQLLVKTVTEHLDAYKITEAGRAIAEYVNELSTWYVRRSRDRFRAGASLATLEEALRTVTLLLAPFTPLVSEMLYAELGGEKESVHLDAWPSYDKKIDADLVGEMDAVRRIVEVGHSLRDEAEIKLRQPLAEVEIEKGSLKGMGELLSIIAEELNVKSAKLVDHMEERGPWRMKTMNGVTVGLMTEISEELKREGWLREIARQINDLRKEAKLTVADRIQLFFDTKDDAIVSYLMLQKDKVLESARATGLVTNKAEVKHFRNIELDGKKLWIGIEKE